MKEIGKWRIARRETPEFKLLKASLYGRRAANAEIKNLEPRVRDDCYFMQQPEGGENGPGVIGNRRRGGAMCHHANRARRRFGLLRMMMGRLCRRRPQHQGQAEPNQPSGSRSHTLLH